MDHRRRIEAGRTRGRRGRPESSPGDDGEAEAVHARSRGSGGNGREVTVMSKFFIRRPIVAMVISILMVIVGARHDRGTAGRSVSSDRPAGSADFGRLHRRGRANRGAIRRHSHRAADERRGQHELHVFAERHGQGRHAADRGFRRQDRSEHRSDPGAEPHHARGIPASGRSQQLWRHGAEDLNRAADAGQPELAEQHLGRAVPGQLRLHQPQRSAHASAGHRQRPGVRRRPVCDAAVGQARSAGQARHHGARNRQRGPDPEHGESSRSGGRRTDSQWPGIYLLGSRAQGAGRRPKNSGKSWSAKPRMAASCG